MIDFFQKSYRTQNKPKIIILFEYLLKDLDRIGEGIFHFGHEKSIKINCK